MIPAGSRDALLTLWRENSTVPATTDNTGQMVASYSRLGYAWGKIASAQPPPNAAAIKGQKETWSGYHMNVDAQYVITIDYRGDLQATDRIEEIDSRSGTSYMYQIAGDTISSGGDEIIPVALVVNLS